MIWFELDAATAAINARKHGLRFDTAKLVFGDPHALMDQDRIEGGEHRWRTIGEIGGATVVVVAHTINEHLDGDEVIRIISARAATIGERRRYEKEKYRHL